MAVVLAGDRPSLGSQRAEGYQVGLHFVLGASLVASPLS